MLFSPLVSWFSAWRNRRQVLGEFARMRRFDSGMDELKVIELLADARSALIREDRAMALRVWKELDAKYRELAKASPEFLAIALELRLFDEAEAILAADMNRHSSRMFCLEGLAQVAQRRGDAEEAIRRWELVRRKFPQRSSGYYGGAASLVAAGRLAEAGKLAEAAVRKFPGDLLCHMEYANVAVRMRNWPDALKRWEVVDRQFHHLSGPMGMAESLKQLGRFDEAEEVLRTARLSSPIEWGPVAELARVAEARGDLEEATRRWLIVRERFPLLPFGYFGETEALLKLGRAEEADAVMGAAVDRFPDKLDPLLTYASLAHNRQDWEKAASRWEVFRARFPDRAEGYERGAHALDALGRKEDALKLRSDWTSRAGSKTS